MCIAKTFFRFLCRCGYSDVSSAVIGSMSETRSCCAINATFRCTLLVAYKSCAYFLLELLCYLCEHACSPTTSFINANIRRSGGVYARCFKGLSVCYAYLHTFAMPYTFL